MPRLPLGIASDHRAPREWFPALTFAVALALPSLAGADVLVKQKTVSEGLGGFGNASTEGTLVVSGDRSRSEDLVTYTGRFKSLAGKPKQSISITRLDKELMWSLDTEKHEYSELTFAEMRAMMAKGAEQASTNAQGSSGPQDEGMTFSVDVKKTGVKQEVNGFPCEQVVITCTGKPTDPKRAEAVSEVRMTMDQWMTRKAPGQAEMASYHRAFAEKLGRDAGMAHMADAARAMYGNGMKELTGKLKDLEGFPIRSTFTIESVMSGEHAQQIAGAQKDAEKAHAEAEREMARAKAERAQQEKQEDTADAKSMGSSIASGGGLGGALGGFLGKKASKAAAKKASAAAEAQAASASGTPSTGGPMFKSVTEVLSITTDAVPAGSFEVPAGYSRQKK